MKKGYSLFLETPLYILHAKKAVPLSEALPFISLKIIQF